MPKPKPNGFMCFVMEWKKKQGRQNMSVDQAVQQCGSIWQNMNAQERAPYLQNAKRERGIPAPREKLDCIGRPLKQVQMEREEVEQKERQMKRTIDITVKNSVKNNELETQKYFFIMVNYFTKNRDGVFVPAELAVSQYSLKEGVHRRYHTLINPGVDIFGYHYEAQKHTEATHALPLPPKAKGEHNLGNIYNDILDFIRDSETDTLPPLYTHRDHIAEVKSVLNFLQSDVCASGENLDVFCIQYLFYVLKEATCEVGEQNKPSSIFITDAFFERDFFDYATGISCQFHEDKDRTKYCALSYVIRWGFMFSDYMCSDLAILPIPGAHVPQKTNLSALVMNSSTLSTSTMNNSAASNRQAPPETKPDVFWQRRWENSSVTESKYSMNDFPTLDAKKKCTKSVISAKSYEFSRTDNIDMLEDVDNPWSARERRQKPREPDSSVFEMNFESAKSPSIDEDAATVSSFGRGRGRIVPKKMTTLQGTGRGRLYDN